jgi:hypothetical protein
VILPIEGRTIATGKFPASLRSIASAKAFVNAIGLEEKCKDFKFRNVNQDIHKCFLFVTYLLYVFGRD